MAEPLEPLLTSAEMAAADRAAVAAGLSIDTLMEAAGLAVANAARRLGAPGAPIAVLCGPGNNGGDGYVAARILQRRGGLVRVHALSAPAAGGPAARAARTLGNPVRELSDFAPESGMLVIDALFGAGLTRPLEGPAADAAARVAASGATCLAVDVPSGLDADTGRPLGPCFQATGTVTFFHRKPGHLLWPGRALCGRVSVAQIGLEDRHLADAARPLAFRNTPALFASGLSRPSIAAHKYQRGHVVVASGAPLATGASRLAAQAALHAGAGAVTIAGSREALLVHAAHVTAVMLREAATPGAFAELLERGRFGACVIGPAAGLGPDTLERIAAAARAGLPCVLDADAITALATAETPFPAERGPWVLTPHEGEFERLFGALPSRDATFAGLTGRLRASKLERARAAARLSGCVIVLKGIDTVVAAPDGRAAINDNGGPELATAGSGDVLSGLIAAHLAHGMSPFEAAAAGVWLHAACGAAYGEGLTAERLLAEVRPLGAFLSG